MQAIPSPEYFELLRAWLHQCDGHEACISYANNNFELPTRVIDVGKSGDEVVLRLSAELSDCSYIALSHCWGKYKLQDKQQICTHASNYEHRKRGFSIRDLPKTFQDAIEVTRQLRKLYLWIDSLCIIQEVEGVPDSDSTDWETESKRMENVFASAYCTLAASSAISSHTGFLQHRPTMASRYIPIDDLQLYLCEDIEDFDSDVERANLNKRGWVLQERILSRRTIHFSTKQTYFECGEGVCSEDLTFMKR